MMLTRVVIGFLALALGLCADDLARGFGNPPMEGRLRAYWWWLNGNVTKGSITRDLEEMRAKGFGGAILFDAGGADARGNEQVKAGPVYGSIAWRELFVHALQTADRMGLELSLSIQSGWNLGGPTVRPENSAKLVTWERVAIKGPATFSGALPVPKHNDGFYRDIAVLAYPLRHGAALAGAEGSARKAIDQLKYKAVFDEWGGSAADATPLLNDVAETQGEQDALLSEVMELPAGARWNVPAGDWEVLRFGYTTSGSKVSTSSETWEGRVIDYLDHEALDAYWNDVVEPILAEAKPYVGRSLKHVYTDSWELKGVNWTSRFREEFRKRRGYGILPYLPVFAGRIIESRAASNRFLNDLRQTVSDLIWQEHYSHFAALARQQGLGIHPESGGPHGAPIDSLRMLGLSAFPQMEFWAKSWMHRVRDDQRFFVKQGASAAHIYGKKYVAAEGLTTIGPHWQERIGDNLKPSFDRAVCEGLNLLIWHTFTASPPEMGKPGQEYFAGTHFNPNITWWNQSTGFTGYINRVQFMMQQGLAVADGLVYYGDHIPNFVRLKPSDPGRILPGYDYDVANAEVLIERVQVKDGRLVLPDGMSYRMLILPDLPVISPAVLRRVRDLAAAGATVIGPKPERATGLASDEEVRRIAGEVWAKCASTHVYGKGRVICGKTAREVAAADGLKPDFEAANLDYLHRRDGAADIYFVSNQGGSELQVDALFRVAGRAPELWNAETGDVQPLWVYDATSDGRTRVPLRMAPYGSALVVFRQPAGERFVSATAEVAGPDVVKVRAAGTYEARDWRGRVRKAVGRAVAGSGYRGRALGGALCRGLGRAGVGDVSFARVVGGEQRSGGQILFGDGHLLKGVGYSGAG